MVWLLLLLKVNLDLDQYLDEIEIKIQVQLYTKVHIMHIVNFWDNRQYDIFSLLIFSVIKYDIIIYTEFYLVNIMLYDSLKRSTQSRLAENFFRTINVHYLLPGSAEGVWLRFDLVKQSPKLSNIGSIGCRMGDRPVATNSVIFLRVSVLRKTL